jgi:Na+-translocating ferredoxin:NAD+ oxidoreductase subunit B
MIETVLAITCVGFVCSFALAIAAKFFDVKEDPRIEETNELLPGVNCGACGYAGCADYAKAIVLHDAELNLCAPGGSDLTSKLCEYLGKTAAAAEKQVAIVLCIGTNDVAKRRFDYNGIADCRSAHLVGGGDKACTYGCLGYASCANVCPTNAIEMIDGVAKVHPELCISCGKCVSACPRDLIKLVPEKNTVHILCSSKDKGPVVRKVCTRGCIGCTMCVKLTKDEGSIEMDGFLAKIDYTKEVQNKVIVEKCPTKCIIDTSDK